MGERLRHGTSRGLELGRRHWLFVALLVLGTALRVLAALAYRPALIFPDSVSYLDNVARFQPYTIRPLGYPAFLKLLPIGHELAIVPAAQHLMGLGIAFLIYALLLRLGVPRWGAALAAAPVLLDAYQVDIEEFILSETLFDLLIVAGAAALVWRPRPGPRAAVAAGLLFAAAALTRANGVVLVAPALLTLLFLRAGWRSSLALVAAVALPLVAYAFWFQSVNGTFGLTSYGGRFLYARVAPFADCSKFSVPADERFLCPTQPVGHRPTSDGSTVEFYMWNEGSPVFRVKDNRRRGELAGSFAKRVILHQPLTYLRTVAHDFLRDFALTRSSHRGELPISRWQFQLTYPKFTPYLTRTIRAHGDRRARVVVGPARILRSYQRFGFVPGPVLAVLLLVGTLAALVGARGDADPRLRVTAFLFTALALLVLVVAVAVNQFSWRYQLPELVLLPPAGAAGLTVLLSRRRVRDPAPEPEPVSALG